MRKYFIIILFILSNASVYAQNSIITMPTSNPSELMGALEHIAPVNPFGHKNPWIIYLHGIDHLRAHPISSGDTSRIRVVENKGVPKLTKFNPLPLQKKPGGSSTDYFGWNVIAPQGDSDDNQWPADKISICLTRIRTNYATTTDTSLIIMIAYSLGGGGAFSLLRFSSIGPYIDYCVPVAGGYINTPDYANIAASAINIDVFASIGDQLASTTARSDVWVNGIKAQNPIQVPNYFRFADMSTSVADHDYILQQIVEDSTPGESYLMANGDTWVKSETIYTRGLRFFGAKRRLNSFPVVIFLIPGLFKRRRRAA